MRVILRPIKVHEKIYAGSLPLPISCDSGIVGISKVKNYDFVDSKVFIDEFKELSVPNTPVFFEKFTQVIKYLSGGDIHAPLKNKNSLKAYRRMSNKESFIGSAFAYRVDLDEYSFIFKFDIHNDNVNIVTYCYTKENLDKRIQDASQKIKFTAMPVEDGDYIVVENAQKKSKFRCWYVNSTSAMIGDSIFKIKDFESQVKKGNFIIRAVL